MVRVEREGHRIVRDNVWVSALGSHCGRNTIHLDREYWRKGQGLGNTYDM